MTVKIPAPYFFSYANLDRKEVDDLLRRLTPYLDGSRKYEFTRWKDSDMLVGVRLFDEMVAALERHRIALLMVSPTFLVRPYIVREELPRLTRPGKLVLPVALKPVDYERQDLHGLESLKIFTMLGKGRPRAYSEFTGERRDAFALELYRAIEDRLDRDL